MANNCYYDLGSWISTKFKYHSNSFLNRYKYAQINCGEVWYCDLGYNVGTEKNKVRPVLVISNNRINRSEKVTVLCITDAKDKLNQNDLPAQDSWYLLYSATQDNSKMFKPNRIIPRNNVAYGFLDKDSVVQCEEIRAVSKARFDLTRRSVGRLDTTDFNNIKQKFQRAYFC